MSYAIAERDGRTGGNDHGRTPFESPAPPGTMIRILGTCAYGPRIRNNLPCRKARLAFRDIHTTAKGATSEFMGKSHRRLKSFANDFGIEQIGAVHPSRRLFQTSSALFPSSEGNRAAVKGSGRLGSSRRRRR